MSVLNLSKKEIEHIMSVHGDTAQNAIAGLRYLIDNWGLVTNEIMLGYDDIYDEYINDILIRSSLEGFISSGPDSLKEKVNSLIISSDERFLSSTHRVDFNIARESEPGVLGIWERLPNNPGPTLQKHLRTLGLM